MNELTARSVFLLCAEVDPDEVGSLYRARIVGQRKCESIVGGCVGLQNNYEVGDFATELEAPTDPADPNRAWGSPITVRILDRDQPRTSADPDHQKPYPSHRNNAHPFAGNTDWRRVVHGK